VVELQLNVQDISGMDGCSAQMWCLVVVPELVLLELPILVLHRSPVEAKGVVAKLPLALVHLVGHLVVHVVLVHLVGVHLVPVGVHLVPAGVHLVHAGVHLVPAGVHLVPAGFHLVPAGFHLVPAGFHLVHAVVHVVSVVLVMLVHDLVVALLHHLVVAVHPSIHTVVHVVLHVLAVPLVHVVVHAVVDLVGLFWADHHIHHLLVPGHLVVVVLGSDVVLKARLSLALEHPVLVVVKPAVNHLAVVHVPPGFVLALEHALVAVDVVHASILAPHVLSLVAVLSLLHHAVKRVITVLVHHLVAPLVHQLVALVHPATHLVFHVVLHPLAVHLLHPSEHLVLALLLPHHVVPLLLVELVGVAIAHPVNVDAVLVHGLLVRVFNLGLVGEPWLGLSLPLDEVTSRCHGVVDTIAIGAVNGTNWLDAIGDGLMGNWNI